MKGPTREEVSKRERWVCSPEDCYKKLLELAIIIKNPGLSFNSIYAIPKGGLPVGTFLSNFFKVPLLMTPDNITPDTLVADDIVSTGKTMRRVLDRIGFKVLTCSIYVSQGTIFKPDFFVEETPFWVEFPWEPNNSSGYDGTPPT